MPLQQIAVFPLEGSSGKKGKNTVSPLKTREEAKETLHADSPTPRAPLERCESRVSSMSGGADVCRICQCDVCEIDQESPQITPCCCDGSMKYVHQACLQKWLKSSEKSACELCHYEYTMTSKTKPFREWEKLEMTRVERRKITCSVSFHIIAITCVVWSLYVLIDRTTQEVMEGALDWPFWTKLIVVAIGFTGGLVFMYVQCKMYVRLCQKWRTYNKLICVENAPLDANGKVVPNDKKSVKKLDEGITPGVVNTAFVQGVEYI